MYTQYLGDWYTQYTFPPSSSSCLRAQYGSFENGTISVYNIGSGALGFLKTEVCGWAEQASVARWQNLIPSFPRIAPELEGGGEIHRKEGIKF